VAGVCNGTSCIILVLVFYFYHCLLLFLIIYPSMLFMVFRLSHDSIIVLAPSLVDFCVVSLLFAIFSLLSLSFLYRDLLHLSRGAFETSSLPSRGSGKVCVHSTLPRPHLWDFTGYVVVVSL